MRLNLVTDRTQEDVRAQNDKGTYNASDLNRVGKAMLYVAERLRLRGYAVSVSPKTDWAEEDIPTPSAMAAYLTALSELRRHFAMMQSTPFIPNDMDMLTFQEANDIEKILEDIHFLLTNAAMAWFYSADMFSGEV